MHKPPVALFYPSYVVEYAVIDSTVTFMDRKTLNVGGEWLGAVPKLAICKNTETSEFHLSHCGDDWEDLCAVESRRTLDEIKEVAEKHYKGIRSKWLATGYSGEDAANFFEEEGIRCSFCGESHFDGNITSMVTGENANICNMCIESFSRDMEIDDS